MNKLNFVTGLPRSGSTLILNILGQNPNHYVTPTSGLIELFVSVRNNWKSFIEFKAEGLEKVKPRVKTALRGLLYGYFEKEFSENKVVFDKSRGWLQYIEDLEYVLDKPSNFIVTVRDIRQILASFEKIYQRRDISYTYATGEDFFKCQTIEGRCECILDKKSVVGIAINRFRDVIKRKNHKSRLMIIPYPLLANNTQSVLKTIHEKLELEPYHYDLENIKQITHEDDNWHGMSLHTIKNKLSPSETRWQEVLPEKYGEEIGKRYEDINILCQHK